MTTAPEAPLCPYCHRPSVFLESSKSVYGGRDFGPIFRCDRCDAHVGCHRDTLQPLGRLADRELRTLKIHLHALFDPLWRDILPAYPDVGQNGLHGHLHRIARQRAYAWLAHHLKIKVEDCHVAMFGPQQCLQAIGFIEHYKPTSATIREWAKERNL